MLINPFKLADREAYGYGYYFGVLTGFVGLSVAGNVAYYMADEITPVVVAASHGAPPVIFALMVHLGLTLSTSFAGSVFRAGRRGPRASRHVDRLSLLLVGTLVVSVIVVAAIALVVSFSGLDGLALRMGWGRFAWTLPVLLDVPAGVATIGVLLATHHIKQDAAASSTTSTPSITADEFLRVDSTPVDQHLVTPTSWRDELADDLVVAPSTSTDDLLDAATSWADEFVDEHPVDPVELSPATSSSPARHPADQPVRHDDDLDDTSATSSSIPVGDMPVDVVTSPTTSTVEVVDDVVATSDELIATPSTAPTSLPDDLVDDLDLGTDELGDELSVEVVGDLDEHRRRADAVVATSKISANADELATVLALDADGVSKQAIADRVGRSRSTVTGWLKTAADATPTESDRPIRPALVAVND